MSKPRVIIVGGGAAGFFAAIACAEANPGAEVCLYELTANLLAKVRVSGGGRCNVTHACFEPRELVKRYPRGGRELLGAFSRWQPRDTIAWFAARGVELKTEGDGRMFPTTDASATIIECLTRVAGSAGVKVRTNCGVKDAQRASEGAGFIVMLSSGEAVACDRLLIATGGGKMAGGLSLAQNLGHTIEPPVPSLFTFHIDDARLKELAGLSVENAVVAVTSLKLREQGPLLITHWGLSGPVILRLSAWGARVLHGVDYKFTLTVNWLGGKPLEAVRSELAAARTANPRKQVATWNPFSLPQRLWEKLVAGAGVAPTAIWTSVSNQLLAAIAGQVAAGEFVVAGKSMNKEEFVTCGGVRLAEVDFKTMQSRVCPGLFFAGEVLDVDGITGGFNFQAAWTTGWLAGKAMSGGSA
jgi:predicted Rossmann fold flavoprotein